MNRLQLYNSALLILGEGNLASLSENREPRRLLDHVWDTGGVKYCLERGQWKFATRTVRLDSTPSVEPEFGYQYAFERPSDFVRTTAFCSDEYFDCPLDRYSDEGAYWYAEIDPVYVRYVSNDSQYGGDMSLWPESFTQYVAHYFAYRICRRETQSGVTKEDLRKETEKLLSEARSIDAMAGPAGRLPSGSWTGARRGRSDREGRGNKRSLIG